MHMELTEEMTLAIESPTWVTWDMENCKSKNLPGVAAERRLATLRTWLTTLACRAEYFLMSVAKVNAAVCLGIPYFPPYLS